MDGKCTQTFRPSYTEAATTLESRLGRSEIVTEKTERETSGVLFAERPERGTLSIYFEKTQGHGN